MPNEQASSQLVRVYRPTHRRSVDVWHRLQAIIICGIPLSIGRARVNCTAASAYILMFAQATLYETYLSNCVLQRSAFYKWSDRRI